MAMQRYQVDMCAIWKIQHDWSIGLGCTNAMTGPAASHPLVVQRAVDVLGDGTSLRC